MRSWAKSTLQVGDKVVVETQLIDRSGQVMTAPDGPGTQSATVAVPNDLTLSEGSAVLDFG